VIVIVIVDRFESCFSTYLASSKCNEYRKTQFEQIIGNLGA